MSEMSEAVVLIDDEAGARGWLESVLSPTPIQWRRLERYVALLIAANETQNLIAQSTVPHLWVRHILDSAQLLRFVACDAGAGSKNPAISALDAKVDAKAKVDRGGLWLDLGSGAGLPGLVIAILSDWRVGLVESRRLRYDFLRDAVDDLGLAARVSIYPTRLELLPQRDLSPAVISARAFAPLARLLDLSTDLSTEKTCWLLPKGKNTEKELELLDPSWQRMFHVEHSLTDSDSRILIGIGIIRSITRKKSYL